MVDRLFVYGTLRRSPSGRMHPLLVDCAFLSTAYYQGIMYDLGPYPAVMPSDESDDQVVGDLLEMSEPERIMNRLDLYEGVQYRRLVCEVVTDSGDRTEAWLYLFRESVEGARRVASGDYQAR